MKYVICFDNNMTSLNKYSLLINYNNNIICYAKHYNNTLLIGNNRTRINSSVRRA